MLDYATVGLYRKDDWAFIANGAGSRLAITRAEYEQAGHQPKFIALQTEDDFNEQALSRRSGDDG